MTPTKQERDEWRCKAELLYEPSTMTPEDEARLVKSTIALSDYLKSITDDMPAFKPSVYYSKDGDHIDVCWSDEQSYSREFGDEKWNTFAVEYSQATHQPIGVSVYSIAAMHLKTEVELSKAVLPLLTALDDAERQLAESTAALAKANAEIEWLRLDRI